jgi:UDP-glucose 4-epimerase
MPSELKHILVTGGAGFIGTNLVQKLKSLKYNVIVLDNLSYGKKVNYIQGVTYIEEHTKNIDILNLPKLDLIFHLGEYSKITPSYDEIQTVFDLNIQGSFAILEYAKKHKIPIVYAASSTRLATEGDGHSPYSFFKSVVTQMLKNYSNWYGIKYSICYFYNVYGPLHDSCNNGWETVISIFEKQYKANQPLTVVGDGSQHRDFTYVGDIVNGLIQAANVLNNDEYQLGSGEEYSILEVAHMFSDNIKFIDHRKGDRKYSKANIRDTCTKLNWSPKTNLYDWIQKIKKNYEQ